MRRIEHDIWRLAASAVMSRSRFLRYVKTILFFPFTKASENQYLPYNSFDNDLKVTAPLAVKSISPTFGRPYTGVPYPVSTSFAFTLFRAAVSITRKSPRLISFSSAISHSCGVTSPRGSPSDCDAAISGTSDSGNVHCPGMLKTYHSGSDNPRLLKAFSCLFTLIVIVVMGVCP